VTGASDVSRPQDLDARYVAARRVLLDALTVLAPHGDAIILAGAQAVYLHTGTADLAIAPYTTVPPQGAAASPPRVASCPGEQAVPPGAAAPADMPRGAALACARTSAVDGLQAVPATVEVDIARGLPDFRVICLADAVVREHVRAEMSTVALSSAGADHGQSRAGWARAHALWAAAVPAGQDEQLADHDFDLLAMKTVGAGGGRLPSYMSRSKAYTAGGRIELSGDDAVYTIPLEDLLMAYIYEYAGGSDGR
jgi:hypothetical protein